MATLLYFVRMREIKAWELIHGTGIYAHGLETPSVPRLFFLFNFFQFFKKFFFFFWSSVIALLVSLLEGHTYADRATKQPVTSIGIVTTRIFNLFSPNVLLYNEG